MPYLAAPMLEIRPLATVAPDAVEELLDAAFGHDRKSRTAYQLRAGVSAIPELSIAAFKKGSFVGSLQSWPVALKGPAGTLSPLTLVGPVAVLPECQGTGVGKALMNGLLDVAQTYGHDALVMIGDPEYYGRHFGFTSEPTGHWDLPGPFERHRLLARIDRPAGVPVAGQIVPDLRFASRGIPA